MKKRQKIGEIRHIYQTDGKKIDRLTEGIEVGKVISLVGGGGKSSTMYHLGKEFASQGQSVILTTTTRILPFANPFPKNLSCVGIDDGKGKWMGLQKPDVLQNQCDRLLIEADGSKGLPLKMPKDHEPVIPPWSDTVIAVVGLSAIGQAIEKVCHRPELVASFLGKEQRDFVTPEDLAKIILSDQGLHKDVGDRKYVVILNQADREEDLEQGRKVFCYLPDSIKGILTSYEPSILCDD